VILVQRALEKDAGSAATNGTSTQEADTAPTTTDTAPTTTGVAGPCRRPRYRVRAGDTLESIAARFDTTVADLLELNPTIDPLALKPTQRIRVH